MISSNTRASRSASRFSSPAQQGSGKDATRPLESLKTLASEEPRTFLQKWLEPTPQNKASFEEAGLMRHGVLDGMAPLGALPKPKKAAAAGENHTPVRRIILKPSGGSAARAMASARAAALTEDSRNVVKVPAMSPPASPLPPSPPKSRRKSPAILDTVGDMADDDDGDPNEGQGRRRRSRRITQPIKKPTANPTTEPRQVQERRTSSTGIVLKLSATRRPSRTEDEEPRVTDRVVAAAVDEALKHHRYPTAWALRTLYDERSGDADFVAMFEDVFSQTADEETMRQFFGQMEARKREGKKDNRACLHFMSPATPGVRFTPPKPMEAPYADLIHEPDELPREATGRGARKKAKTQQHEGGAVTPAPGMGDDEEEEDEDEEEAQDSVADTAAMIRVKTPKHARKDSASSDSSLSTAPSMPSPEVRDLKVKLKLDSPAASRGAATALHSSAKSTGAGRPIKTRGKSVASSKHALPNPSPSISPTTLQRARSSKSSSSALDDAGMPGRVSAADLFPNLKSPARTADDFTTTAATTTTTTVTAGDGVQAHMPEEDEDEDSFWDRRWDARRVTNAHEARPSSVRDADADRERTPVMQTRRTRHSLAASVTTRATRSASKRPHDDVEGNLSPLASSLPGDAASSVGSRAVTPTSIRPAKKQKTGLRVKSSPVKKKGGTAAGVPRPVNEAISSVPSGPASKDPTAENDESCSACGNAGDVVCCDGCPRSFHFECVDMVRSDELPDEWYCNECLIRRYPSRVPVHKGIFGSALNNLEKSIPRAFSLPKRIQSRFEGVRAGADGDYEEAVSYKTAKKRNGYDELPDFFKQREDGQAVLCHACQRSATEIRAIIPCSVCPFYWHLDCLDPPLAVPPVLKTWRCPAHVDDVLVDVPSLAPAHRFRRIKGAHTISPAITRGLKNNGHIEIDWTDEPDEPDHSGWHDVRSFGRTYKLPAKAVVLDFIEQLRNQGAGRGSRRREAEPLGSPSPPIPDTSPSRLLGPASDREIGELQVSLNLAGLRQKQPTGVDHLTSALLATADDGMLSLMAKSNAEHIATGRLTDDDRLGLRAMLAQMEAMTSRIRQVLGDQSRAPTPCAIKAEEPSSPITESNSFGGLGPGKIEQLPPVTEPTPPSTVDHAEGSMELD